jgi:trehalose 6-phosphate phosphatase
MTFAATFARSFPFQDVAILLDVDGTILDFAPTPLQVRVPPSLPQTLMRLWERTNGALAFVSGRPIHELDLVFSPLQLPAIGGHGAELRLAAGADPETPRLPPLDPSVKRCLATVAEADPGIILEDKGYSLALHYRLAPDKAQFVQDAATNVCAGLATAIEVLPGNSMVEIKQRGFNKGTAVRELMTYAPFAGRIPTFLGDDVTDWDVFKIIPEFRGIAMSVGEKHHGVDYHFDRPTDVRRWLEQISRSNMFVLPEALADQNELRDEARLTD